MRSAVQFWTHTNIAWHAAFNVVGMPPIYLRSMYSVQGYGLRKTLDSDPIFHIFRAWGRISVSTGVLAPTRNRAHVGDVFSVGEAFHAGQGLHSSSQCNLVATLTSTEYVCALRYRRGPGIGGVSRACIKGVGMSLNHTPASTSHERGLHNTDLKL